MKRSEMVKQLRECFLKHMHCGPECCADDGQLYSTVLAELEAAGMQPPAVLKSPDMYIRSTGEYGYYLNEWEEED